MASYIFITVGFAVTAAEHFFDELTKQRKINHNLYVSMDSILLEEEKNFMGKNCNVGLIFKLEGIASIVVINAALKSVINN